MKHCQGNIKFGIKFLDVTLHFLKVMKTEIPVTSGGQGEIEVLNFLVRGNPVHSQCYGEQYEDLSYDLYTAVCCPVHTATANNVTSSMYIIWMYASLMALYYSNSRRRI